MQLILKREPQNPYDKNAVAVWILARAFIFFTSEVQIGYLNAEVAEEIARYIDKGGSDEKRTLGVNILLTKG